MPNESALVDMAHRGMIPYSRHNRTDRWKFSGRGSWPDVHDNDMNPVEKVIADIVHANLWVAVPNDVNVASLDTSVPIWKNFVDEEADKSIAMTVHKRVFGIHVEFIPEGLDIRAWTNIDRIPEMLKQNLGHVLPRWGGSTPKRVPDDAAENVRARASKKNNSK